MKSQQRRGYHAIIGVLMQIPSYPMLAMDENNLYMLLKLGKVSMGHQVSACSLPCPYGGLVHVEGTGINTLFTPETLYT